MSKLLKYKLFFFILFLVFFLDQISKILVLNFCENGIEIIPGFFDISLAYNTGAAWSIFSGYSYLLGIFGISVLILIFLKRKNLELIYKKNQLVFGLLCGGIIGNIVDRFFRGQVIDFIDVYFRFYHWPIFNIADISIFLSVLLYFIVAFCNKNDRI